MSVCLSLPFAPSSCRELLLLEHENRPLTGTPVLSALTAIANILSPPFTQTKKVRRERRILKIE
jgi:hypothetical protein